MMAQSVYSQIFETILTQNKSLLESSLHHHVCLFMCCGSLCHVQRRGRNVLDGGSSVWEVDKADAYRPFTGIFLSLIPDLGGLVMLD